MSFHVGVQATKETFEESFSTAMQESLSEASDATKDVVNDAEKFLSAWFKSTKDDGNFAISVYGQCNYEDTRDTVNITVTPLAADNAIEEPAPVTNDQGIPIPAAPIPVPASE